MRPQLAQPNAAMAQPSRSPSSPLTPGQQTRIHTHTHTHTHTLTHIHNPPSRNLPMCTPPCPQYHCGECTSSQTSPLLRTCAVFIHHCPGFNFVLPARSSPLLSSLLSSPPFLILSSPPHATSSPHLLPSWLPEGPIGLKLVARQGFVWAWSLTWSTSSPGHGLWYRLF